MACYWYLQELCTNYATELKLCHWNYAKNHWMGWHTQIIGWVWAYTKQDKGRPGQWIEQWNYGSMIIVLKCIWHTIKKNITKRFTRTLRTKAFNHVTAASEKIYINELVLDNTYHKSFTMKPTNTEVKTYIDYDVDKNDKHPEFKVGNHAGISKDKNTFAKRCTWNWCEQVFVVKNACISLKISRMKKLCEHL